MLRPDIERRRSHRRAKQRPRPPLLLVGFVVSFVRRLDAGSGNSADETAATDKAARGQAKMGRRRF
jgi:hypothetical protein